MTSPHDGLARSVQTRLASHAKAIGVDPNLVFTLYGLERFLYRLSRSAYADRFVLKGALLLLVWLGETLRPTRDADLLGFGELADEDLLRIFQEVCDVEVEPDAVILHSDSVVVMPIRERDAYGGRRVKLDGSLGAARLTIQADIGIGDAVTPAPQWLDYPTMLDLPRPRLRTYSRESVVAEKVHAMVVLGSRNSRLKDYFDVYALLREDVLESHELARAIAATFARRLTEFPKDAPAGLSDAYAHDPANQARWQAFLRKGKLNAPPLDVVVAEIRARLSDLFDTAL